MLYSNTPFIIYMHDFAAVFLNVCSGQFRAYYAVSRVCKVFRSHFYMRILFRGDNLCWPTVVGGQEFMLYSDVQKCLLWLWW